MTSSKRPGETDAERQDRNYVELLQELRVAQTGVQILFAFLLVLPFQAGFSRTSGLDRGVYVVTLLAATAATALLIAPVGFHRMLFRQGRKKQLVDVTSRFAEAGLGALLIAISGALFVVLDVVAGLAVALCLAVPAMIVLVVCWFVAPALVRRMGG